MVCLLMFSNRFIKMNSINYMTQKQSGKIGDPKPEKLICYYGKVLDDNIKERLDELVKKHKSFSKTN